MAVFNPLDAASWQRWAQDFDNTSRLFAQQFSTLQRLGPYVHERHPELLSRYNSLVASGARHQATLATLQRLRNDAGNWLRSIGQAVSGAVNASMDWLRNRFGLGGMGAVPIVAIVGLAAAAGAILVIANWIKESFEFTQRLNALFRLEQSGLSAQEAARVISQTVGAPGGNFFGIPLTMLFWGAAALLLGPPVLRMIRERGE